MTELEARDAARRTRDPDEETRYRAVRALDPAAQGALPLLMERLGDESWRVRKAAVDRLCTLPDPAVAVPQLVDALGAGDDAGARNSAAEALARIGQRAVAPLLGRLDDADTDVRKFAVDVLGEIRDRASVPHLARKLQDADANVRASSAEALGKIGGDDAAAALEAALSSDDHLLKLAALDALSRLRVSPSVERLAPLVRDRFLRRPVYRLLGRLDDPRAQELLVTGAAESTRGTREAALAAIAELSHRVAGPGLAPLVEGLRHGAREVIGADAAAALRADDALVAEGALAVLGWLGDASHAPAIAHAAEDERLRPAAVAALAAIGPAVGPALREALQGLTPSSRAAALGVLARVGDATSLPALVDAMAEDDEEVRAAAIDALGQLGDARAVGPLALLLESGEPGVAEGAVAALALVATRGPIQREAVVAAARDRAAHGSQPAVLRLLGAVGGSEDVAALRAALRGPEAGGRRAAAEALGTLGAESGLEALRTALADEDSAVRGAAARALGALARPEASHAVRDEAARALSSALRDAEPMVRAAAAESLGRAGAKSYAGAVAELAADPASPPPAAIAALRALAALGLPDPAALARAAQHPDAEVVKEAVAAAAQLAGAPGQKVLLDAARHARWDVRRAAARAIAARGDRSLAAELRRLAAAEKDSLAAEAFAEALRQLEGTK